MQEVVIVAAVRTAIGTFNGALAGKRAPELGKSVITAAMERAGIGPEQVEEVIMGNVLQAGLGQNPARQAALTAGIGQAVPAYTINKVCGSGLKAVALGAQAVALGEAEVVVAGGMENMSAAPYLLEKARLGYRMGNGVLVDEMLQDGLIDAFHQVHMGLTAENIAARYGLSREQQDEFALASQLKARRAIEAGRFKEEIVPVEIEAKRGQQVVFDKDEHPRFDTTLERLAGLKPAFKKDGTVTAGNASGLNDGAAALVLMSSNRAHELGIKPLARIVATAAAGVDPLYMGLGPIPATRKALDKVGLKVSDLDLIEANEAFAAQALAVIQELGLPGDKTNVNGGAIALGHPIGASGARILVTLVHELRRQQGRYGLATLCIGGGMGIAMIIEGL